MAQLEFRVPMPRAIVDFTMSAWYANHIRAPLADVPGVECWFSHARPVATDEYDRAFAPATLRFAAPAYGFVFDTEYLHIPLASSDPDLHVVLCDHVAMTLAHLDSHQTLAAKVRDLAMNDLGRGNPTASGVAAQLRMSSRTLSRRLEREGTTFGTVLDQLRRELALRYVGNHGDIAFAEVGFRLGFAHVEAFHRAFKRWTGVTPLTYRRECQRN